MFSLFNLVILVRNLYILLIFPPKKSVFGLIDIFPIMLYFLLFSLYDCSQLNFFFKFFFL